MYHVYRFNAWIYVGIHGHYHLEGDAHKEKKYNSSVILRDGGYPVGPLDHTEMKDLLRASLVDRFIIKTCMKAFIILVYMKETFIFYY